MISDRPIVRSVGVRACYSSESSFAWVMLTTLQRINEIRLLVYVILRAFGNSVQKTNYNLNSGT